MTTTASDDWISEGACRSYSSTSGSYSVFYPDEEGVANPDYSEAKAICMTCPVRVRCLDHAMNLNEQYGVWGGLSPSQRRELRRKRRVTSEECWSDLADTLWGIADRLAADPDLLTVPYVQAAMF